MLVLFGFNIDTPQGVKQSPRLLSGDMRRLEELLPSNPVWKKQTRNVSSISIDQAKSLYDEMVEYYAKTVVSSVPYQGNALGPVFFMSDLQSVFDDLIAFFETQLGFTCSLESKAAIARKQDEHKARVDAARSSYTADTLAFFKTLGTIGPPSSVKIRERLTAKLAEYRTRLAEDPRWKFKHPQLAFLTEQGYRDTTYKIVVAETILEVGAPVSLEVLAKAQLEHDGPFDAEEFFMACAVIATYLETPIAEGQLLKRENGQVHTVAL